MRSKAGVQIRSRSQVLCSSPFKFIWSQEGSAENIYIGNKWDLNRELWPLCITFTTPHEERLASDQRDQSEKERCTVHLALRKLRTVHAARNDGKRHAKRKRKVDDRASRLVGVQSYNHRTFSGVASHNRRQPSKVAEIPKAWYFG